MNELWNHILHQRWNETWILLGGWGTSSGLRILIVLVAAFIALRAGKIVVSRFLGLSLRATGGDVIRELSLAKRRATLLSMTDRVLTFLVVIVAGLMVFRELNFDIGPILASAGVLGIAVGFGAQTLVRDLISGAFFIVENQFDIGDVVKIGETSGLVEAINLRTIALRDLQGTVHIIPNGEIKFVSVLTKDWSRYVLDVDVSYQENVARVLTVLREILDAYAQNNPALVLETPEILGIESFGENAVRIRALIKTVPSKQWEVGRAVRMSVKEGFDREGIEIQQKTLWMHDASREGALARPQLSKPKSGAGKAGAVRSRKKRI